MPDYIRQASTPLPDLSRRIRNMDDMVRLRRESLLVRPPPYLFTGIPALPPPSHEFRPTKFVLVPFHSCGFARGDRARSVSIYQRSILRLYLPAAARALPPCRLVRARGAPPIQMRSRVYTCYDRTSSLHPPARWLPRLPRSSPPLIITSIERLDHPVISFAATHPCPGEPLATLKTFRFHLTRLRSGFPLAPRLPFATPTYFSVFGPLRRSLSCGPRHRSSTPSLLSFPPPLVGSQPSDPACSPSRHPAAGTALRGATPPGYSYQLTTAYLHHAILYSGHRCSCQCASRRHSAAALARLIRPPPPFPLPP
ncbi:hypothetical protein C8R43DRAFT_1138295 [Mycena crocata]|nr:hypothetical protein C8R43DRAFT_1138295 [Mycena crocata]